MTAGAERGTRAAKTRRGRRARRAVAVIVVLVGAAVLAFREVSVRAFVGVWTQTLPDTGHPVSRSSPDIATLGGEPAVGQVDRLELRDNGTRVWQARGQAGVEEWDRQGA